MNAGDSGFGIGGGKLASMGGVGAGFGAVGSVPLNSVGNRGGSWRDLMDQLKNEFESVAQELRAFGELRDEYTRSLEKQYSNVSLLEQALFELDRKHQLMKQEYEREVGRLKEHLAAAYSGARNSTGGYAGYGGGNPVSLLNTQDQRTGSALGLPLSGAGLSGSRGPSAGMLAPHQGGLGGVDGSNGCMDGSVSLRNSGNLLGSGQGVLGLAEERELMTRGGNGTLSMSGLGSDSRKIGNDPGDPAPHPRQHGGIESTPLSHLISAQKEQGTEGASPASRPKVSLAQNALNEGKAAHLQSAGNRSLGLGTVGGGAGLAGRTGGIGVLGNVNAAEEETEAGKLIEEQSSKRMRTGRDAPSSIGNMPSDLNAMTTTTAGVTTTSLPAGRIVSSRGDLSTAGGAGSGGVMRTGVSVEEDTATRGPANSGRQQVHGASGGVGSSNVAEARNSALEDYSVIHENGVSPTTINATGMYKFRHDSVICCVRYSWDGSYIATGSNWGANLFDTRRGQLVASFRDLQDTSRSTESDSYVRAVCFTPDGRSLVTGGEDHTVKIWDLVSQSVRKRLVGHESDIFSVDVSADGRLIASGSGDKSAKLWLAQTGQLLHTYGGPDFGPNDGVTGIVLSPDGKSIAMGSLDMAVRVWDTETGRLLRILQAHSDSVYSVAFAPDGRSLLSGSLDKTLKLWDLSVMNNAMACRMTLQGHRDYVLSVGFSPSGRWIVSGSKDKTVQFWDVRNAQSCLTLQGHQNSVISVSHSPRTNHLATGAGDFCARIWKMTYGA